MLTLPALAMSFVPVPTAHAAEAKEQKVEEKVPLDQVPLVVKQAAEQAVKGFVSAKAVKQTIGAVVVYELSGKAGKQLYVVKATPEGKVLKVEEEEPDEPAKK